jgi:4-hydroxy-3-methylbut-2-enyl diphosphate reductase
MQEILLANPRGFCAGVDRAIEIVERALDLFGAPIYVRHEVVHNRTVVKCLRERGAVFVDELDQVPAGATVVFSAHGVPKAVQEEADARDLRVFDATCPLVTKVHVEVAKNADKGREVLLIGHRGHPEVEGTLGQYRPKGDKGAIYLVETMEDVATLEVENSEDLAFVTQTTLSVSDSRRIIEALRARFPAISTIRKDDICYATQNRQDAVKSLGEDCDVVLVVGSPNSSNSNRLREIAAATGVPAYLIDTADDIQRDWLAGAAHVGVSAGASAPESLVREVVGRLRAWGAGSATEMDGEVEGVVFRLPIPLRQDEVMAAK